MRWRVVTSGVLMIMAAGAWSVSFAEIPDKSRDDLLEEGTQAFTGRVERLYRATPVNGGGFEFTHSVAEMTVASVEKGTDIRPGDRVFVRHWRKRWVGKGQPPPDHYGHRTVPAEKQTVAVFVSGTRQAGYDVLSPNGYSEVVTAKAKSNAIDQ